jgi:hypothetical protein
MGKARICRKLRRMGFQREGRLCKKPFPLACLSSDSFRTSGKNRPPEGRTSRRIPPGHPGRPAAPAGENETRQKAAERSRPFPTGTGVTRNGQDRSLRGRGLRGTVKTVPYGCGAQDRGGGGVRHGGGSVGVSDRPGRVAEKSSHEKPCAEFAHGFSFAHTIPASRGLYWQSFGTESCPGTRDLLRKDLIQTWNSSEKPNGPTSSPRPRSS